MHMKISTVNTVNMFMTKQGKIYRLLTKCEVKMDEYWPVSFFAVYIPANFFSVKCVRCFASTESEFQKIS